MRYRWEEMVVVEEKEAWETPARVWATLGSSWPVAVLAALGYAAGGAAGPTLRALRPNSQVVLASLPPSARHAWCH